MTTLMSIGLALAVLVCGGLGSVARYLVDDVVRSRWTSALPWATLAVNVAGSGLLGLVTASAPHQVLLIVGTGFCGGFTTLSTASVEVVGMVTERRPLTGLVWMIGQAVLCIGAAAAGLWLG